MVSPICIYETSCIHFSNFPSKRVERDWTLDQYDQHSSLKEKEIFLSNLEFKSMKTSQFILMEDYLESFSRF